MGHRERPVDRGRRRGREISRSLVSQFRVARVAHALSQREVAAAVGLSDSEISRIETSARQGIPVELLATLLAVVGLDLSANAYPAGAPLRDSAHLRLLARLQGIAAPEFRWLTEVPIRQNDLRAWDAMLVSRTCRIGVEAETRTRDLQAVARSTLTKVGDSEADVAILLLANTRHHRQVVRDFGPYLSGAFPIAGRVAIIDLEAGRCPAGNAIVLL